MSTRKLRRIIWIVAVAWAIVWSGGSAPTARAESDAQQLEQRREQLFAAMLERPDNLDVAFEYAALSTQAGDYEAAASTLERMLIFAPGLPRIQLELGVIYYRLGAYETALSYFNSVMSGPNVPPEVKERVDVYLKAIAERQQPNKFTGSGFTGVRWQSNANLGPGSRSIVLNGLPFLLDESATGQDDFNFFTAGSFHYSHDLENQGDRLEASLLTYSSFYTDETQLDTQLAELTAGPSFNMGRFNIDDTYVAIYGIVNGVLLDNDAHFGTLGGGIRTTSQPSVRTKVSASTEVRQKYFNNTRNRPTSTLRDGLEIRNVAAVSYVATSALTLYGLARVTREDARAGFYDNWEFGGYVGGMYTFPSPVMMPDRPWAYNFNAGYLRREFDSPDPTINAAKAQHDDEFWVRGSLSIPLTDDVALMPQVEYREVSSNYGIRAFSNVSVILGIYWKL